MSLLTPPSDNMYEGSHENYGSHDVSPPQVGMTGFPAAPFSVPAHTCGLFGGLPCALPLDNSVKSVRLHLRLHGHMHPQRQIVQCSWMGCSDGLRWMNIPRHIQSVHLGIRFKCFNCGKLYTRPEGLERHTISQKCIGLVNVCSALKKTYSPPSVLQAPHTRGGRG